MRSRKITNYKCIKFEEEEKLRDPFWNNNEEFNYPMSDCPEDKGQWIYFFSFRFFSFLSCLRVGWCLRSSLCQSFWQNDSRFKCKWTRLRYGCVWWSQNEEGLVKKNRGQRTEDLSSDFVSNPNSATRSLYELLCPSIVFCSIGIFGMDLVGLVLKIILLFSSAFLLCHVKNWKLFLDVFASSHEVLTLTSFVLQPQATRKMDKNT